MEKWKKRSINLLFSLVFGSRGDPSVVKYCPQKTKLAPKEEAFFLRSNPEKQGISSKRIYNMLCELEMERRANLHSLMIISGGEVISECSVGGYSVCSWQVSHSMAKTVAGMVIGALVSDGLMSLETKLVDVFPELEYRDRRFPAITVDHLLSMTCGVEFAEAGAVTEERWTEAFFRSPLRFSPGSRFSYNSMNTYILARMAERVTKKQFGRLADEKIFAPLGIKDYFWEKGPEGTEKAGWGLYMSPESWGRVGYMILCEGEFFGKRILSKKWVKISTSMKAVAPESSGGFNYAYQMWVSRDGKEVLFNGMLGQNVWICPQNNIVVVMTGGNNEMFQVSAALEIVRRYLGAGINDEINKRDVYLLRRKEESFFYSRRWIRFKERGRGFFSLLGIGVNERFDSEWNNLLGSYSFATNNIGLLPLILRAMQNNLNSEIQSMSFERQGERLYLRYVESGEENLIHLGFYKYEDSSIGVRGEIYRVMAAAECVKQPGGEREYKIELIFPETSSVRRLVILNRESGVILVKFSETPNDRIVKQVINEYSGQNPSLAFAVGVLERRFGSDVLVDTARKTFNPALLGVSKSARGYRRILNNEQKRASEESGRVRLVRALITRFFKDTPGDEASKIVTEIEISAGITDDK